MSVRWPQKRDAAPSCQKTNRGSFAKLSQSASPRFRVKNEVAHLARRPGSVDDSVASEIPFHWIVRAMEELFNATGRDFPGGDDFVEVLQQVVFEKNRELLRRTGKRVDPSR